MHSRGVSKVREKILIWCHLNAEQDALESVFGDDCISVRGSDPIAKKESALDIWRDTDIPIFISKPRIYGYGLNLQFCHRVVFVGLSDSWESFYQAVRRCWRFGQDKPVHVHIVTADTEGAVLENIRRKQAQHDQVSEEMAKVMKDYTVAEIKGASIEKADYVAVEDMRVPAWL